MISSFVLLIPVLFCIRNQAWGSLLPRNHFCDPTVVILWASKKQNVSQFGLDMALEKNIRFVYC